jgi:hypothetical protein
MKTFKMKSMQAAIVAGLGALGISGAANAVHVNPDGLGQVLIFPYYTACSTRDYVSDATPAATKQQATMRFVYDAQDQIRPAAVLDANGQIIFPNQNAIDRRAAYQRAMNAHRQKLIRTVYQLEVDPAGQQKAKAKHYELTRYAPGSSDWRDMNITPEAS